MADFPVITSATPAQVDVFSAVSGTTLTATTNVGTMLAVFKNGTALTKGTGWTVAGQVVTFAVALASDNVMLVYTTSQAVLAGNVSFVHQEFTPASGVTTLTLSQTGIGGVSFVARNGVVQRENTDYTVNYTTGIITLTTATSTGESFTVVFMSGGGGVGNATTLNGFTSSQTKLANAVPVADASGHIPTGTSFGLRTRTIILNGTTSYTYPVNTQAILVQATGAGGGGAGCVNPNNGANATAGGGGGGGGYSESFITALPGSPVTVAVGAGGAGGAAGANNGNAGTATSFNTSTVIANGGGFGQAGFNAAANIWSGFMGAGGAAGTGDVTFAGSAGTYGATNINNGWAVGGNGGSSGNGSGGGAGGLAAGSNTTAAGGNGGHWGGGGGGASASGVTTASAGGNGANGIMVISEFY